MEHAAGDAVSQPGMFTWRTVLVLAALAAAAWWVWHHQKRQAPVVDMQPNVTPPPPAPVGVPMGIPAKMAAAVDTSIPVVMTSGSVVQFDEDEIRQVVRKVLDRLNGMDEDLTLLQVATAAKTVDSYKTVSYDISAQLYDPRENIAMSVVMQVLVPLSGKLFIRTLRLLNTPDDGSGPAGIEGQGGGLAAYEDSVAVLKSMKL